LPAAHAVIGAGAARPRRDIAAIAGESNRHPAQDCTETVRA